MTKKKVFPVLFFTLLLTLLLGSFTNCFAWSYPLRSTDLYDVITNSQVNASSYVTDNFYTQCYNLLQMDYDVYAFVVYDSGKTCRLEGWNNSAVQTNSTANYVSLNANDRCLWLCFSK